MGLLLLGLVVFLGTHLVPTSPAMRGRLKESLGDTGYMLLFSAGSLAGLVAIAFGFGEARAVAPQLWDPPVWTRHLAMALMLPALILLAAAYIPSRIRDRVRHPMLAAIKIWALAHLIANGDLASLLLFGSFLAYGVFDRISVKRRGALGPLGNRTGGLGGDLTAVLVGSGAWLLMLLYGHQALIGVPVLAAL